MTAERKLMSSLAAAIAVVLVVSLIPLWFVSSLIAERNAMNDIDAVFRDVATDMVDTVDIHLVHEAMVFRDRLKKLEDKSVESLRMIAFEMEIEELNVVDTNGVIIYSSIPENIGFDFKKPGGDYQEFLCLLDTESEYAQKMRDDAVGGELSKYAGVWIPSGGFIQVGAKVDTLQRMVQTEMVSIASFWHIGEQGSLAIITPVGLVLSATDPELEGSLWVEPDDSFYWKKQELYGFTIYGMVPKSNAADDRNFQFAVSAIMTALALLLVSAVVGFAISRYVKKRIMAERKKEMEMARAIQSGSLPRVFPPFPEVKEFDIFAQMIAAKDVGGDFYDFYFVGPTQVLFLIADVSGKGVPAALFMMKAKTIIKNLATSGRPLDEVITAANDQLCDGNDASMFVTLWAGVIDFTTGKVCYVNAGHNPPLVLAADGRAEYRREVCGLVLGALPGVKYRLGEFTLEKGGGVYLYTDGITEQQNSHGELFGEARTLDIVGACGIVDIRRLLGVVQKAVTVHAGGLDQSDDCTQLILRFNGARDMV